MADLADARVRSEDTAPGAFAALGSACARLVSAERDRWVLWLPVAFGTGIAIYFALPAEPPVWAVAVPLGGALGLAVLTRRYAGLTVTAIAMAAACVGFALAQARTASVAAPVLEKRIGPAWIEGRVVAAAPRGGGYRLLLDRLEVPGLTPEAIPARARIRTGRSAANLGPGERIAVRAVLRPPPGPAAPGAFDFARRAYFQRLGAVGYAMGRVRPVAVPTESTEAAAAAADATDWTVAWSALRHDIAGRVRAALPGEAGAVAAALMTGVRGAIPERVMQDMRDSGLAHLLAISGLHMGLVAGLLFFALRAALACVPRLALDFPIKKWAAVGAALGAFGYLFLTGATVPTQRAFVMVGLVLLAVVLDRSAVTLRLVAWAAVAILATAPESLLSASFQLSFAAVTALVAGYEGLRERRARLLGERGVARSAALYLAAVVFSSLLAGLATAPFAVYHFNRIAWFGLVANLAAVPLTALWIMPWALVAFALLPFGLEAAALAPMGWGIDVVLAVARWVAGWPGAVSIVPAMPVGGLVLIAFGGLWLCIWRRPWRLAGLAIMLSGALTVPLATAPDVLVNADGRLFAVRGPDGGLFLSSGRVARFEADVWRRRAGRTETVTWPQTGAAIGGRLRCDPLGCIYRVQGRVVALVQDPRALRDDCAVADAVVSRVPVRRRACPGRRLIVDRFDLWREGSHALWLSEEGMRLESAADRRGRRPWVPRRGWD